jgi:hypothetical protein
LDLGLANPVFGPIYMNDAQPGDLEVQDFDFEDIAGLGIVHIDRTEDGIGQAEIQRLDNVATKSGLVETPPNSPSPPVTQSLSMLSTVAMVKARPRSNVLMAEALEDVSS